MRRSQVRILVGVALAGDHRHRQRGQLHEALVLAVVRALIDVHVGHVEQVLQRELVQQLHKVQLWIAEARLLQAIDGRATGRHHRAMELGHLEAALVVHHRDVGVLQVGEAIDGARLPTDLCAGCCWLVVVGVLFVANCTNCECTKQKSIAYRGNYYNV